jgi:hypothetical protein
MFYVLAVLFPEEQAEVLMKFHLTKPNGEKHTSRCTQRYPIMKVLESTHKKEKTYQSFDKTTFNGFQKRKSVNIMNMNITQV